MLQRFSFYWAFPTFVSRAKLCAHAVCLGALVAVGAASGLSQARPNTMPLRIYFIDTEGGQSTLFVLPDQTSMLVDTGFPRANGRDANRIARAAKLAGIERIDYMLFTHYHVDHIGGLSDLIARIPIGTFIDHGLNHEPDVPITVKGYDAYQALLATGKYKQITVKPGDKLPIPGTDITVITSDGNTIDKPLPGAGKHTASCATPDAMPADIDLTKDVENGRSIGFVMNFGKVRILDLGDLTWDRERTLMCPVNKVGHINLFVVPNHGSETSTSPILIQGITPQVVLMNNGERKGAVKRVLDGIRNASNKPDLWQLHAAMLGGDSNTNPAQIANLLSPAGEVAAKAAAAAGPTPRPVPGASRPQGQRPPDMPDDAGYMITVEAKLDGTFKLTNERTGQSHDYVAH